MAAHIQVYLKPRLFSYNKGETDLVLWFQRNHTQVFVSCPLLEVLNNGLALHAQTGHPCQYWKSFLAGAGAGFFSGRVTLCKLPFLCFLHLMSASDPGKKKKRYLSLLKPAMLVFWGGCQRAGWSLCNLVYWLFVDVKEASLARFLCKNIPQARPKSWPHVRMVYVVLCHLSGCSDLFCTAPRADGGIIMCS